MAGTGSLTCRDHEPKGNADFRYFTIDATMPPDTGAEEFRLMLQRVLVERFALVFHRETRKLAQYEITFAEGGPKMTKAKPVADGPPAGIPDDNENLDALKHRTKMQASNAVGMRVQGDFTVARIADQFSPYLLHPLVDQTGSTDYYAIDLTWGWNPNFRPPLPIGTFNIASDRDARELFSEMEKRLGLRVTLRSAPVEILVIDSLSREASKN